MTIWKRLKRLWALFGTEEVVNEDSTTTRRSIVLRSSRVYRTVRPELLWRRRSRHAQKSDISLHAKRLKPGRVLKPFFRRR
jgi:hypothetical protein